MDENREKWIFRLLPPIVWQLEKFALISTKCHCRFRRRTCVGLNSECQYCLVCRPAENLLDVEYSIWRMKVLSDEVLSFCRKICQWNEKADNALQYVLQYVQQRHSLHLQLNLLGNHPSSSHLVYVQHDYRTTVLPTR